MDKLIEELKTLRNNHPMLSAEVVSALMLVRAIRDAQQATVLNGKTQFGDKSSRGGNGR